MAERVLDGLMVEPVDEDAEGADRNVVEGGDVGVAFAGC